MKFSHNWMSDTHPDALREYLRIQSRISPEEKLKQISEMWDFTIALETAEVRRLYPDADDREVFLRVRERWLGPDLMMKAYGWRSPG